MSEIGISRGFYITYVKGTDNNEACVGCIECRVRIDGDCDVST